MASSEMTELVPTGASGEALYLIRMPDPESRASTLRLVLQAARQPDCRDRIHPASRGVSGAFLPR